MMKTIHTLIRTLFLVLLAAALLTLVSAFPATAQEPDYTLDWWTVDGGGIVGQDAILPYTLGGTIGQPDAGVMAEDPYTLQGGFWPGGTAAVEYTVYLPLTLRSY